MTNKGIRRGQVWFHKPEYTPTGHIQKGPRPVIIVSNDHLNQSSSVVLAVPCTTQLKRNFPTHVLFIMNNHTSVALTEQMGPVNVEELTNFQYSLEEYIMNQVDEAIKVSLGMTPALTGRCPAPNCSQIVEEPVNELTPVDNDLPAKPTSRQVDKFYAKYPQLKPKDDSKGNKWTDDKVAELIKDYESGEKLQTIADKWGITISTLRTYYSRFKLSNCRKKGVEIANGVILNEC